VLFTGHVRLSRVCFPIVNTTRLLQPEEEELLYDTKSALGLIAVFSTIDLNIMRSSEKNGKSRKSAFVQNSMQNAPQEGLNWVVILGGTIASALSVTLGRKLKQALENNRQRDTKELNEPEGSSATKRTSGVHPMRSNLDYGRQGGVVCFHCFPGAYDGAVEMKLGPQDANFQFDDRVGAHTISPQRCKLSEIQIYSESTANSPLWVSPEQLDLPNVHLHQSNSSESVCTSDTGSDVFSKRDVIHRLREQLKRRDEMILEMQAQITDQQQIISNQISQMTNLQSQLDAANRELFGTEREIQRLRKAIADHCAGHAVEMSCSSGTMITNYTMVDHSMSKSIADLKGSTVVSAELCNGGTQRFHEQKLQEQTYDLKTPDVKVWNLIEDLPCVSLNRNGEMTKLEDTLESVKDLERELAELKRLVSGKNYLLEAYENQRVELCTQLKELQLKLGTEVASVL